MADLDHEALDDDSRAVLDELASSLAFEDSDDPAAADRELPSVRRDALAAKSDFRFRQMFGGQLWHQHHVHAHHLMTGAYDASP